MYYLFHNNFVLCHDGLWRHIGFATEWLMSLEKAKQEAERIEKETGEKVSIRCVTAE